jgi:hypothetical protein
VLATDPPFVLTSEVAAIRRESMGRFVKALVHHRAELRRALTLVRGLPRITVPVSDTAACRDLTQVLRKRLGPIHYRSYAVAVLALTKDDKTEVISKLIVDGEHARLHTFIQNGDKAASNARFLLTEFMVESLRASGVKYLFVDTILGLPGGLRYLQHPARLSTPQRHPGPGAARRCGQAPGARSRSSRLRILPWASTGSVSTTWTALGIL